MAKSAKVLNEEIKAKFLESVSNYLADAGEEVLRVGSNEVAIPVLDGESNEKWLVLTFKVPTGSRDGDAYDGYSMAEDWAIKCKTKEETAKKKAEEKAKKIERDEKMRAKKKEKAEE